MVGLDLIIGFASRASGKGPGLDKVRAQRQAAALSGQTWQRELSGGCHYGHPAPGFLEPALDWLQREGHRHLLVPELKHLQADPQ